MVTRLFENATFAAMIEFVVFTEDYNIICIVIGSGRGVHYGI